MKTTIAEERVAFESWVRGARPERWPNADSSGRRRDEQGENRYFNVTLQLMWETWLAARQGR